MKKLTKTQKIEMLLAIPQVQENTELVEFLENEKAIIARKNSSSAESKTQKENAIIKEVIVAELTRIARPVTITELQNESAEMSKYSNQKLSALLNQLANANVITKVNEKKKSFFSI